MSQTGSVSRGPSSFQRSMELMVSSTMSGRMTVRSGNSLRNTSHPLKTVRSVKALDWYAFPSDPL